MYLRKKLSRHHLSHIQYSTACISLNILRCVGWWGMKLLTHERSPSRIYSNLAEWRRTILIACGCSFEGSKHTRPILRSTSLCRVCPFPSSKLFIQLHLSSLTAENIGVTSIQHSQCGATEEFTAGSSEFDLQRKVSKWITLQSRGRLYRKVDPRRFR